MRPLLVSVADLLRRPGARRAVQRLVVLPVLALSTAAVPDDEAAVVDLMLESIANGIVATGTIRVPWVGECRRCLEIVHGETLAEVHDIFDPHPVEGETYPLAGDNIDLEPLVRDAVLLTLPLAPLCRADCLGPAPDVFPALVEAEAEPDSVRVDASVDRPVDDRWAALDQLRFD
jgi:uncharacterized protein